MNDCLDEEKKEEPVEQQETNEDTYLHPLLAPQPTTIQPVGFAALEHFSFKLNM